MNAPAPHCTARMTLERELECARACALAAGREISNAWTSKRDVEYKGSVDLVTATDKKCEEIIFKMIRETFPEDDVVGEETHGSETLRPSTRRTWYVDPLDGTTNFVHGFPFACVSVGLCVDGKPAVGVVHNPTLNETFEASLGGGARLNGNAIAVSACTELGRGLIGTEIGVHRDEATVDAVMGRLRALTKHARSVRCSGSCAMNMCGVAMGRLDGFFEIGFGGPWDCVAGAVIVREAGGVVLDPSGEDFDVCARRVLCANAHVGSSLVDALSTVPDGPDEPQKPSVATC